MGKTNAHDLDQRVKFFNRRSRLDQPVFQFNRKHASVSALVATLS